MDMDFQQYLPLIKTHALSYGLMALKALMIFVIGKMIAKLITKLSVRIMQRSSMDAMLVKFIKNMIYAVLLTFVVIATISSLGIQTASLVAVIGAAGLAIGLALQGSLSNFAAGVLMIIFRPYKLGDRVEVAGTEGVVEEVEVFTTVLRTPNKTKVIIPNGQIMSETITNYTDADICRLDLTVGISYDADIDATREVLLKALPSSEYVLSEPAPKVTVSGLGDNSVDLAVRPWIKSSGYAAASHDVNEVIKKALDAANIGMPYPQRDVHIYNHED